ncbi:winged helix-turn-helix transcriptional regulator [Candidatus Saccharibacteria bacterium]|jgi:SOS-response transcriptional repressor LexA|nr:winged helix-turn-helix transcriptional regulator [Candidatus Saccharibacteria bacterium]
MNTPTKKQQKILKFIQDFTIEHDYSPSYREIQRALGLSSVSAVAEHISNCEKAGFLKKIPNAARTLEVIPLETHEETQKLFQKHIAELETKLADDPENQSIKDDLATLKAAAKLLNLAI